MNIRRRSLTDSMQLLVDTICNLFGSIVIISLLMALVSNDVPVDAHSQRTTELQREVAQVRDELAEAQRFESTIQPRAQDAERLALADRIADLKVVLSSNLVRLESSNNPPINAPQQALTALANLLIQKTNFESELTTATNQLDRLKQANTRQLRLPRERATGKKTFYFICRFGKIYPVHLMRDGRREINTQTLDWRETADGQIATPRRELGVDIPTGLPAFARFLNDLSQQTYSIHFLVYNDSFPTFLAARQIPLARNFDTGWEFFTPDRPIVFSPQGEAPPVL
jgi:hypothetical protein